MSVAGYNMNNRFKKNGFAQYHFNLFDDPDIAFFSYINVLIKFMDMLLERVTTQKALDNITTLKMNV